MYEEISSVLFISQKKIPKSVFPIWLQPEYRLKLLRGTNLAAGGLGECHVLFMLKTSKLNKLQEAFCITSTFASATVQFDDNVCGISEERNL